MFQSFLALSLRKEHLCKDDLLVFPFQWSVECYKKLKQEYLNKVLQSEYIKACIKLLTQQKCRRPRRPQGKHSFGGVWWPSTAADPYLLRHSNIYQSLGVTSERQRRPDLHNINSEINKGCLMQKRFSSYHLIVWEKFRSKSYTFLPCV